MYVLGYYLMRLIELLYFRELDEYIMEATISYALIFDRCRDSIVFPNLSRMALVAFGVESMQFALVAIVAWKTVRRGVAGPFYLIGSLEVRLFRKS